MKFFINSVVASILALALITTISGCTKSGTCLHGRYRNGESGALCAGQDLVLSENQIRSRETAANAGDLESAKLLVLHFRAMKDEQSAQKWLNRAGQLGNKHAEAQHADYLATQASSRTEGIERLMRAALQQNAMAAYFLMSAYTKGNYGLPIDNDHAVFWGEIMKKNEKYNSSVPGVVSNDP